jgi:hypothetical protein
MAGRVHDLRFTRSGSRQARRAGDLRAAGAAVLGNRYDLLQIRDLRPPRWLLIGYDNGGTGLTLVVEPTLDPTTWLVITGWVATRRQRRMVRP